MKFFSMKWSLKQVQNLLELGNILLMIYFFILIRFCLMSLDLIQVAQAELAQFQSFILSVDRYVIETVLWEGGQNQFLQRYGEKVESLEVDYPLTKGRGSGQVRLWSQSLPSFNENRSPLVCFLWVLSCVKSSCHSGFLSSLSYCLNKKLLLSGQSLTHANFHQHVAQATHCLKSLFSPPAVYPYTVFKEERIDSSPKLSLNNYLP